MQLSKQLIIILVISFFLQLLHYYEGQDWYSASDYAGYLMQAISIADGKINEFLIFNKSITTNSSFPIAPIAYPWGFPIILSLLYKLFGLNLIAIKFSLFFFYAGFLVNLWFFFKDELDIKENIIFVSLFAFNPFFLEFGNHILSDIPFLFFSTLTIFIIFKFNNEKNYNNKTLYIILLTLCFFISSIIRSNGLLFPLLYLVLVTLVAIKSHISKFILLKKLVFFRNLSDKKQIFVLLLPVIFFAVSIFFFSLYFPTRQGVQLSIFQELNIKTFLFNCLYYIVVVKNFFFYTPTLKNIFDNFDPGVIIYFLSIPFFF